MTESALTKMRAARIVLARNGFTDYCRVTDPDFYKPDRPHLEVMTYTLDAVYFGLPLDASGKIYKNIMFNVPPRHGKTRTLAHFGAWALGRDNEERIITASYNDIAAFDLSKFTRDNISMQKIDPMAIVFSDVFPETRIKRGSASYFKWALAGQHFNYLGVGLQGTLTGKGGTIRMLDDMVKNYESALNAEYHQKVWSFYTGTFLSRTEDESKRDMKVATMTRWAKDDICGRIMDEEGDDWYVVSLQAYNKSDDSMLCPGILSYERYSKMKKVIIHEIFMANYHQITIDIQGRLYSYFDVYDTLPIDEKDRQVFEMRGAYVDTADEGGDFLAAGFYVEYQNVYYMTDVYYTKEPMEITEPEMASRLVENETSQCRIESNSGGRGFARNVRRELEEHHKEHSCTIMWFHQRVHKHSRIFNQSANVQRQIRMPRDWRIRWPLFHDHVMSYLKEGKNQIDDGPDMLTGIVERGRQKLRWG